MADDTTGGAAPTDDPNPAGDTDDVEVPEGADKPDAVRNALKRQQDAVRAAKAERDQLAAKLSEYEDRDKTEQQKLAERAENAERERDDAASRLAVLEVATAKGIPGDLVDLLPSGRTKEELEAIADKLLERLTPGTTDFEGGARGSTDAPEDMNGLMRRAAGRG